MALRNELIEFTWGGGKLFVYGGKCFVYGGKLFVYGAFWRRGTTISGAGVRRFLAQGYDVFFNSGQRLDVKNFERV